MAISISKNGRLFEKAGTLAYPVNANLTSCSVITGSNSWKGSLYDKPNVSGKIAILQVQSL